MQYLPYTRFAYAISVIPEGQEGGRSLPWTVSNEACQTCRDDLLVRNPLKILAVQETCRRSFGWTRENIWECVRINGDSKFRKIGGPRRGCRRAFQAALTTWPSCDVSPLPFSWHAPLLPRHPFWRTLRVSYHAFFRLVWSVLRIPRRRQKGEGLLP